MKVRECYKMMGADYEDVSARLLNDDRIKKFLARFLDSNEYDKLIRCIESKNYEEAFRSAHTLKGVCLNLGIKNYAESVGTLCEALREGEPTEDIRPMVEQVKKDHDLVMESIKNLSLI